jgi:hypothetical protein
MELTTAIEIYNSRPLPDDLITLLQMNGAVLQACLKTSEEITTNLDSDEMSELPRNLDL